MHKKQWQAVCGFVVDGCESISDSSRTMKDIFRIITEQRNSVLFRYEVNNRIVSVSREEFQRRTVSVARKIQECVDSSHKMLGLHMKSGLEWAVVFWGILMSGHIPVILDENKELFQYRNLPNAEGIYCISKDKSIPLTIDPDTILDSSFEVDASFFDSTWVDEAVFVVRDKNRSNKGIVYNGYAISEQALRLKKVYKYNSSMLYPESFGKMRLMMGLSLSDFFGFVMGMVMYPCFGGEVFFGENLDEGVNISKRCRDLSITHMCLDSKACTSVTDLIKQRVNSDFPRYSKEFTEWASGNERVNDFRILSKYTSISAKLKKEVFGGDIKCIYSADENPDDSSSQYLNRIGVFFSKGYCNALLGLVAMELSPDSAYRTNNSVGVLLDGVTGKIDEDGCLVLTSSSYEQCGVFGSTDKLGSTVKIERRASIDMSGRVHFEKALSRDDDAGDKTLNLELVSKLRNIYAEALNRPLEIIGENMDFFSELGGDSLTYFLLIQHIEVSFGISIKVEDRKYLTTIKYAVETLKTYNLTEAKK